MAKLWIWIKSAAWPWLRAHWRQVGVAVLVLIGLREGYQLLAEIRGFLVPKVKSPAPFDVVGDGRHITVHMPDGTTRVLDVVSMGLTPERVQAVGVTSGGVAEVEVKNAIIDDL